nr:MAG TPA: hypothetical protein [Caudoviricetes sp.]
MNLNETPYSIFLLVDLYNLYGDSWPNSIKNEVRHELRRAGYAIREMSYQGPTQAVWAEKEENNEDL